MTSHVVIVARAMGIAVVGQAAGAVALAENGDPVIIDGDDGTAAAFEMAVIGLAQVAQAHRVALVPFLLAGVADRADAMEWFQPDRIHPLAKAHPVMLDNVWPALAPLL